MVRPGYEHNSAQDYFLVSFIEPFLAQFESSPGQEEAPYYQKQKRYENSSVGDLGLEVFVNW